jgi:hypothetical protein
VPLLTRYLVIGAVLLLANAIGYRIYRARNGLRPRRQASSASPPGRSRPRRAPAAAARAQASDTADLSESAQALLRAHRLAALAALEQGEYASAERELLEAQELDPGREETRDLLRIVRSVEAGARKAAALPRPAPAPEPARPKAPLKVAALRADPPPRPPEPPASGTLLVVSTPPGLLVHVDGQPAVVTPARISVAPGPHSVALVRGDATLYERQVKVWLGGDGLGGRGPDGPARAEGGGGAGPRPPAAELELDPEQDLEGRRPRPARRPVPFAAQGHARARRGAAPPRAPQP